MQYALHNIFIYIFFVTPIGFFVRVYFTAIVIPTKTQIVVCDPAIRDLDHATLHVMY